MKTRRSLQGPFTERPYFTVREIEEICLDALRAVDLLPLEPCPIRIERFIEKRFRVRPIYDDLPGGILGFTRFGLAGVEEVVISRMLPEEGSRTSERRVSTTLAHESGHGLLHAHLFAFGASARSLFGGTEEPDAPKILCRGPIQSPPGGDPRPRYDGRWWEYQANQAMGAILLPRPLMDRYVEKFLETQGGLGQRSLDDRRRDEVAEALSEVFDVNPIVARIRLGETYGTGHQGQLSL